MNISMNISMLNLTLTNPKNISINNSTSIDFCHEGINEVLNDTLKKIARVTGLSQAEAVNLLQGQLTRYSQCQLERDELTLQANNTAKIPLLTQAEHTFIFNLLNKD